MTDFQRQRIAFTMIKPLFPALKRENFDALILNQHIDVYRDVLMRQCKDCEHRDEFLEEFKLICEVYLGLV